MMMTMLSDVTTED